MVNSMDVRTTVRLSHSDGLVEYVIDYPDSGELKTSRGRLGRRSSDRLMRKLEKKGIVEILLRFVEFGLEEQGDFWSVSIVNDDGREMELSGPEDSVSVLNSVVEDLAEILDDQFSVTMYISPSRLDRFEVSFVHDEISPELHEYLESFERCDHTETVCLDRYSRSVRFSRMFPTNCYRMAFECCCDEEIRTFLDQVGEFFREDHLFEDVLDGGYEDLDCPVLLFSYFYHDGTCRHVRRRLSLMGLRDMQYIEVVDYLFELLLHVLFKEGMFDKRFLFPMGMKTETPFFVAYSEDENEGPAV